MSNKSYEDSKNYEQSTLFKWLKNQNQTLLKEYEKYYEAYKGETMGYHNYNSAVCKIRGKESMIRNMAFQLIWYPHYASTSTSLTEDFNNWMGYSGFKKVKIISAKSLKNSSLIINELEETL
jgi:hypothetical protein